MHIQLPKPVFKGNKSLEQCIYERKSVRRYKNNIIEIEKISQILWAAQGRNGKKRTVPSAGATYPLEIYVILKDKGLFQYRCKDHTLELVNENDLTTKLCQAALDQSFIKEAYLNVIICAEFERTTIRYKDRGVRYVFIEVGHCAQNIHLEAVALGLVSVPVGAFNDEKVRHDLSLPKNIEPLYVIPIGYP